MVQTSKVRDAKFIWVGEPPKQDKRIALVIPQFNESLNCNFIKRLEYFSKISIQFRSILDVVIVDDGSTDDSLERIVAYKELQPNSFSLASVHPNSNKVGALYLTILSIRCEYIVLTDFDTDLIGFNEISQITKVLSNDSKLMGCYFRMLPFEGSGISFLYQQLEYSLARSLYKLHREEQSVPVMPGAGSCYKREILVSIYTNHSGLRSGEDRESTILGHKLGYKTVYTDKVMSLTRTPLSFKDLVKQRRRWNLGYIETAFKERQYYFHQIKTLTVIGLRTLLDALFVVFSITFPIFILVILMINWKLSTLLIIILYLVGIAWPLYGVIISSKESKEFKHRRLYSILYYPIYKVLLDHVAWSSAVFDFIKKLRT